MAETEKRRVNGVQRVVPIVGLAAYAGHLVALESDERQIAYRRLQQRCRICRQDARRRRHSELVDLRCMTLRSLGHHLEHATNAEDEPAQVTAAGIETLKV